MIYDPAHRRPRWFDGASHAKAAFGTYWPETSPNCLVISVEVAGTAAEGPTDAQVRSMVDLWDELKARYPAVVPLGHRDFQDVKACPGRTPAMKAAFASMGGHGTRYSDDSWEMSSRDYISGRVCTVRDDARLHEFPGGPGIGTINPPLVRDHLGRDRSGDWALISSELDGKSRTAWVKAKAVSDIRPAPVPSPDCADAIAAEHERFKAAAIAAIGAL